MANCSETINVLVGSVRSGKTIASLISFLILLRAYPGCNIMLVGKSDKTLYRNVLMPLKDIVRPENFKFSRTVGEGSLYNKYHFYVSGAYDEKSFEKIQGITLALAYGDEVTAWPENYFQMLLSRLSEDNAKFIGTCNPEGPYHWLKKKFIDREKEISIKIWNFLIDENKNLPPSYVEKLKQFYTGLFYKRYIQGLWVMAEGAIYDMFSEEKHVSTVTPEQWESCYAKHVSCDYGTGNPTVFQMWGHNGRKRYLKKEYYYDSREIGKQKTDAQYAEDLERFIGLEDIQSVIIDPSAASFKLEVSNRFISVQDADNSVIDGIRDVSSELAQDLIQVDPSCTNYIREKYGYVWDINAGKRGEDKPLKQNDHSADAERYYIHTIKLPNAMLDTLSEDEDIGTSYITVNEYEGIWEN
jgi:PBSX family phage terminase large subunit